MPAKMLKNSAFGAQLGGKASSFDFSRCEGVEVFKNSDSVIILPGFCDVHVHFREPGFSYKETIKSGSMAAARGGFTDVCTMPNLNPVPDSAENLALQRDIIARDAVIGVHPYGAITVGQRGEELADLEAMAENAIGYSDDGKGVQNEEMMLCAMAMGRIGSV